MLQPSSFALRDKERK